MSPALSVVIPNLNFGRYLQKCLDSLRAQTFKDYEVILVDGGSTDCTFKVLKDYPEVKVIMDVPPQGPVKAVNKAILEMKGSYFTQLNADCILEPTIYEECLRLLESKTQEPYMMVYTGWYMMDDEGKTTGVYPQPKKFNRDLLLRRNYIDATSMILRKSCFDAVGMFDERCPWSMDWIMAVKIASKFPIGFLNKPLFYYRVHAGQITQSPKMVEDTKRALKIMKQYYGYGARLKASVFSKYVSIRRMIR